MKKFPLVNMHRGKAWLRFHAEKREGQAELRRYETGTKGQMQKHVIWKKWALARIKKVQYVQVHSHTEKGKAGLGDHREMWREGVAMSLYDLDVSLQSVL